jgi:hypothetical protein
MPDDSFHFEGVHCTVTVRRLHDWALLVEISGRDVGEHGDRPMTALAGLLPAKGKTELFIDARRALGPSTDVSAAWAVWLAQRREAFSRVNMLTGSRFVQLTADFVRKWSALNDAMRIYTDPTAFETALSLSTAAH